MDNETRSTERQATRLRELMRNRFNQEIALKLITTFGGEQEALDFLLNENEEDVRKFMRGDPGYVEDLRTDSENLASILINGFESSVRMFGCGKCTRSWWKKVPVRKEVSRCKRCNVKYDPIPKNKEWGTGKFVCQCGNEFTGYATMGETESICYKCDTLCPVDHIQPPRRRPTTSKSRAPHSCNGVNCYNRDTGDVCHHDDGTHASYADMSDLSRNFAVMKMSNGNGSDGCAGAYPGPARPPTCNHPKSQHAQKKKLQYESSRHNSTGSTVSNVLSQNSIETSSVWSALAKIKEED